MRVGIIQSNYIPWRGYFDFINTVDIFVVYDDVQYTSRDWRNRNLIKLNYKKMWLTVPVRQNKRDQLICETKIDYSQGWEKKHCLSLKYAYGASPFFSTYFDSFKDIVSQKFLSISDLNVSLITWVMSVCNIKTKLILSKDMSVQGKKTERLINILEKIGATTYLSGPSAASYLDAQQFLDAGIGLEYKTYDYAPYPQFCSDFDGGVSVMDLLFNVGGNAQNYITSKTKNQIILPEKK